MRWCGWGNLHRERLEDRRERLFELELGRMGRRKYAEKKLTKAIVLKIEYLKVSGDYCFVECSPEFEDGTDAIPAFLPDMGYIHCLKRIHVGWHVILDMSRTDVPDPEERARIKKSFPGDFPWGLLSPEWKKIFAGGYD